MKKVGSDIEIARAANMLPISDIAQKLEIPEEALLCYGNYKAKISLDHIDALAERKDGKLILVTAISPTPAGEGKTTTTVGLTDGLNRIGKKAMMCLREPSLGPCFGIKGGAAGGGMAQLVPMEDINLHFTGDFHAITAANNLLSALIDNHIYWNNHLRIDPRRVTWNRVLDMNDRALRDVVTALGGVSNGFPRQSGFDITVASEIMAIFCLADSLQDMERRLSQIVVGNSLRKEPVTAGQLEAVGAMSVLLKDAFMPNLVQSLENSPAFVHGGPFANIAHGCNSVMATKTALKLADYVVTEAGFGADLGAEKFFDIKCRKAGLRPDAVVLVATCRALKLHGGAALKDGAKENVKALKRGCINLGRHIRNLGMFGVPVVVAINRFLSDSDGELDVIKDYCRSFGVEAIEATHFSDGSKGTKMLAKKVAMIADSGQSQFRTLYDDEIGLFDKINTICRSLYGADEAIADKKIRTKLTKWEKQGYGNLPVCMAKTQYSFSTDPDLKGAPTGHVVPIRDVRLSAGAEFIVVICGKIMTMPGLPRTPSANDIHINEDGQIEGLS